METRFEAKKAKILKRSDDFEENVKKVDNFVMRTLFFLQHEVLRREFSSKLKNQL